MSRYLGLLLVSIDIRVSKATKTNKGNTVVNTVLKSLAALESLLTTIILTMYQRAPLQMYWKVRNRQCMAFKMIEH